MNSFPDSTGSLARLLLPIESPMEISFYNALKGCCPEYGMPDKEYKEKVKTADDEQKVEREFKDEFGNKVKEKHEVKLD